MKSKGGVVCLLLLATLARGLDVGDKAASLEGVAHWMNGSAVDPSTPDGKTTYIVEFWATWCPPCRQTIPHLSDLADRYAPSNVVLVGVTDEDEATVKPFAEKMGMKYRLALDTKKSTADTWGKTVEGIPHAFLVDTNGTVVWQGHPMDGLDRVLADVLAGHHDPKKRRETEEREAKILRTIQDGNFDEGMKLLKEFLAENPRRMDLQQVKAGLLMQGDDVEGLREHYREMLRIFHDSSSDLNDLAWLIASPSDMPFKYRDFGVALEAAQRAVDLTHGREAAILDTLAVVYYGLGMIDRAIAAEEKALSLSNDKEEQRELKSTLQFLREIADLRAKAARPAASGDEKAGAGADRPPDSAGAPRAETPSATNGPAGGTADTNRAGTVSSPGP